MMRLPFIPTVIVAAAVAVMIGLGIWQLGRADEKERLLAEYRSAATLPPVDLDPLIANGNVAAVPLAFRRALVTCRPGNAPAEARAGRNREGASGYAYWVHCKPNAEGFAGRLLVNAGWSQDPAAQARLPQGTIAGTLGAIPQDGPVILTSATAVPPLVPAALPSIEDIPNNHLSYAAQWFFFAAAAAVIYLLALRRKKPSP